ncbi:hypothetical protein E2C01_009011 [Portunus trituberculatus]|uniref:Uncharacterized protein n=1 Tax=Portunus trituberculatus TaxID=210409 RepID=A0A5B7D4B8_PORTR|nr:hypothetical protein [Portunus trituberculatus]
MGEFVVPPPLLWESYVLLCSATPSTTLEIVSTSFITSTFTTFEFHHQHLPSQLPSLTLPTLPHYHHYHHSNPRHHCRHRRHRHLSQGSRNTFIIRATSPLPEFSQVSEKNILGNACFSDLPEVISL